MISLHMNWRSYNFGIFAGKMKRRYFKYVQFITEELFQNTNIIRTTHKLKKHLNWLRLHNTYKHVS